MMYLQHLNEASHKAVAEFIKVMGASRDFYFWASELVVEETKELNEALAEGNMDNILKELGDLTWVLIGFYQTMPANPQFLISEEMDQTVQLALTNAYKAAADAINGHTIPVQLLDEVIAVIATSNMSKLDDEGNPIRSDGTDGYPEGKVLKGPNYVAPDMAPLTKMLADFHQSMTADPEMAAMNQAAAQVAGEEAVQPGLTVVGGTDAAGN